MNLGPIKGSFVAGVVVVAAFVATGAGLKLQHDQITALQAKVNAPAPTVVVTQAPTATPSAALNVTQAVKSGGLKVSTPAAASNVKAVVK